MCSVSTRPDEWRTVVRVVEKKMNKKKEMQKTQPFDEIILKPEDIDLSYSPIRNDINVDTYVLGAFNPGMSRLPNGNIIIMVRIAEALKTPVFDDKIHSIRWDPEMGYVLDAYNMEDVDTSDPRSFTLKKYYPMIVDALTSLSWLLPVELTADGREVVNIYYDKIISPTKAIRNMELKMPEYRLLMESII